jgi:CHAD domain-containing protein
VKRLRYGCDCFAAGFPPEATNAFQQRLKKLQELLGELNDIAVQRRLLKELACASGTALSRLAARERPLLNALGKEWRKFDVHPPHWRKEVARARG